MRIPAVLLHLPLLFVTLCPAPSYAVAQRAKGTKQVAEFDAPQSAVGDEFGSAVAIQGNAAVAGAPSPIFGGAGLVYVFTKSGSTWSKPHS